MLRGGLLFECGVKVEQRKREEEREHEKDKGDGVCGV